MLSYKTSSSLDDALTFHQKELEKFGLDCKRRPNDHRRKRVAQFLERRSHAGGFPCDRWRRHFCQHQFATRNAAVKQAADLWLHHLRRLGHNMEIPDIERCTQHNVHPVTLRVRGELLDAGDCRFSGVRDLQALRARVTLSFFLLLSTSPPCKVKI